MPDLLFSLLVAGAAVVTVILGAPQLIKLVRRRVRVRVTWKRGPVSRKQGFMGAAVEIAVVNKSESAVEIRDIRLMFCGAFGASVAREAPPGFSHPELPKSLDSGKGETWYIPAEKLSALLCSLYRPQSLTKAVKRKVTLRARCITSAERVYRSPAFQFSTDVNSHHQEF